VPKTTIHSIPKCSSVCGWLGCTLSSSRKQRILSSSTIFFSPSLPTAHPEIGQRPGQTCRGPLGSVLQCSSEGWFGSNVTSDRMRFDGATLRRALRGFSLTNGSERLEGNLDASGETSGAASVAEVLVGVLVALLLVTLFLRTLATLSSCPCHDYCCYCCCCMHACMHARMLFNL